MSLFRRLRPFSTAQTGFAGLPGLLHPSDWDRIARETIEECDHLVHQTITQPPNNNNNNNLTTIVSLLDDISNTICKTVDTAEFCRNVHSDPAWRSAAQHVCLSLGSYVQSLNMNYSLYTSLCSALRHHHHHHHHKSSNTTTTKKEEDSGLHETVLVGKMLKRDFERYGVHLTGLDADKMRTLTDTAAHLGMLIVHNISDPSALGHIHSPLPFTTTTTTTTSGGGVAADSGTLHSLLQNHADETVRKMAYMALHQQPSENIDLFHQLTTIRREIAQMNGHSSWSAYQLNDFSLAGKPAAVHAFLKEVSSNTRELVEVEGNRLLQLKKSIEHPHHQGRGQTGGSQHLHQQLLQPWDRIYYTNIAKIQYQQHRLQLHSCSSTSTMQSALSAYFPLHICIKGLTSIVHSLTGVTLKQVPMLPHEGWANYNSTADDNGSGVLKYEATHPTEGYLGIVYLDLMPRPGKSPSPAHYTLQCRHTRNNQPAAVALVAGLSSSSSSSVGNTTTTTTTGLSLADIETLFHEFGHALHSLVSSTQYQHLSGTRGPLDTVELPSQLFQLLASDPRILQSFFYDDDTTTTTTSSNNNNNNIPPPPKGMIEAAIATRYMFPAMDLQQQFQLIALDQYVLHGDQDVLSSSFDEVMFDIMKTDPSSSSTSTTTTFPYHYYHSYFPHIPTTRPFVRFGHGVGYGGTYHGYLYTECLAMEALQRLNLVERCTTKGAGTTTTGSIDENDVLRSRLLAGGGAKEARQLVEGLLGDDVMVSNNNDTEGGGLYPKSDALVARLQSDSEKCI